jgi:glycosyltransferase involved in cell wall biosynthesis
MRILYPIEGDGGGAVTHVFTLASELTKRAIPTSVAFLTNGPSLAVANGAGLNCKSIPKKFVLDLAPVWKLTRLLNQQKIDIIHTHTIRGNYYGRIAARLCQRPIVSITTVHSHIVDELRGGTEFGPKDWLLCKREAYTWKFVRHFICVSSKIKQRLLSDHIPEHKITVIENAVELADLSFSHVYGRSIRREFHIKDDEIVVGIIGRLVPVKNHVFFLRSAKRLSKRASNVKFLVVGDGPLLESLINKTKELGIYELVRFTRWRNDIQKVLCALDIYVICSVVEGLNISVLEAMACAKPVVGTNVKGISEIVIDGKTGILVPSNCVYSLTEAMLRLANNREERTRMGLNGRRLIEKKYSVGKMIHNTLQVYDKLYSNLPVEGLCEK